jgi:hypothetical protein
MVGERVCGHAFAPSDREKALGNRLVPSAIMEGNQGLVPVGGLRPHGHPPTLTGTQALPRFAGEP